MVTKTMIILRIKMFLINYFRRYIEEKKLEYLTITVIYRMTKKPLINLCDNLAEMDGRRGTGARLKNKFNQELDMIVWRVITAVAWKMVYAIY